LGLEAHPDRSSRGSLRSAIVSQIRALELSYATIYDRGSHQSNPINPENSSANLSIEVYRAAGSPSLIRCGKSITLSAARAARVDARADLQIVER
jgi:hypothetical protein